MARNLSSSRARIAFVHDVAMAAVSFPLALYLRVGVDFQWYAGQILWEGTAIFSCVAGLTFWFMRLYRGVWRYASLDDLMAIAKSVTLAILIFLPIMFALTRLQDMPRAMLIINWLLLIALLGGSRMIYRLVKDRRFDTMLRREDRRRVPILLVGAGDGAAMFLRALAGEDGGTYRVVGIVDDVGSRVGRKIHGIEVIGHLDELEAVVRHLKSIGNAPHRIVITKQKLDSDLVRRLLERAEGLGVPIGRVPNLTNLMDAEEDGLEVKPIAVEDLLGRPQAVLDRSAMQALIEGRRVLVTGAGGTIGRELVRQISDCAPAHMTLLDSGEFNLYEAELELGERHADLAREAVLADVRDRGRIDAIFADAMPELVFHAAALKHVPVVEAHPEEGVLTNVIGTRNVADAARRHSVIALVLISTDKAVNPTSIMGASKRLAESYCQALDVQRTDRDTATRYVTVRFGNVLGSTGSVVPLFERQLKAGGPLTVTHPEVKRYFMTVREAVELVLQASALGSRAGNDGEIFVLDMGEPVLIQHLARQMIRLAGLRPDEDIEIAYTGLRPGEKLNEELLHDAESLNPTEIQGIMRAAPRSADQAILSRAIDELESLARAGRRDELLSRLARLVTEYQAGGDATAGGFAQGADDTG